MPPKLNNHDETSKSSSISKNAWNSAMEYETEKKSPIITHVNSTLLQELDAVQLLAADSSIDLPVKIHECRKHIKKARSVVRMIKHAFNKSTWKALNTALRDSGKALCVLRELDAYQECIATLIEMTGNAEGKDSLRRIYVHFKKNYTYGFSQFEDAVHGMTASIGGAQVLLGEVNFETATISMLLGGISQSYRRCRRLCRSLTSDSPTTTLHEWRKCAKDLRYQIGAIADAWPAMLNALESELHVLTDCLGHVHDQALLMNLLKAQQNNGELAHDCAVAMPLVQQQYKQELSRAFRLGALLFAEKPTCFYKRIEQYLKAGE